MRAILQSRQTIFIIDMTTGSIIDITPGNLDKTPGGVSISPDENRVLYYDADGVWSVGIDGKDKKLIIKAARDADWSPDGKELVFIKDDALYTAYPDGTNIQKIDFLPDSVEDIRYPEWVKAPGQRMITFFVYGTEWDLIDLETGTINVIKPGRGQTMFGLGYSHKWSPDGKWFLGGLYDFEIKSRKVFLCSIEEAKCETLKHNRGNCEFPGYWLSPKE